MSAHTKGRFGNDPLPQEELFRVRVYYPVEGSRCPACDAKITWESHQIKRHLNDNRPHGWTCPGSGRDASWTWTGEILEDFPAHQYISGLYLREERVLYCGTRDGTTPYGYLNSCPGHPMSAVIRGCEDGAREDSVGWMMRVRYRVHLWSNGRGLDEWRLCWEEAGW